MKGIDMLRTKVKNKLNSTINHIKAHPALYGYIAGAAVGIASVSLTVHYNMKGLKLVDLTESLKRIHDEGLTGLKFDMGDETLVLIPVDTYMLNFD